MNIPLAMSQNAEGGYCIVAKVVASALDVVGGMTWRKPISVLYNVDLSSLRRSFTVQILWVVACKEDTIW